VLEVGAPPPPPLVLTSPRARPWSAVVDAEGKGPPPDGQLPLAGPEGAGLGQHDHRRGGRFRLGARPRRASRSPQATWAERRERATTLDPALTPGEVREGVDLKVAKMRISAASS
jgi:hypothetical protein